MLYVLCATCDEFIYAHLIGDHVSEEHPAQDLIRLKTWPNGEPVVQLANEINLFFPANE